MIGDVLNKLTAYRLAPYERGRWHWDNGLKTWRMKICMVDIALVAWKASGSSWFFAPIRTLQVGNLYLGCRCLGCLARILSSKLLVLTTVPWTMIWYSVPVRSYSQRYFQALEKLDSRTLYGSLCSCSSNSGMTSVRYVLRNRGKPNPVHKLGVTSDWSREGHIPCHRYQR